MGVILKLKSVIYIYITIFNYNKMLTVKIPYQSTDLFYTKLYQLRKQQSSVIRYSYNRYLDDIKQKEIRAKCKNLNNIALLNVWMIQCGIMKGAQLYNRFKNKPDIIFGGKYNFKQRIKEKITKEQYQEKRLLPLTIQGEKIRNGNRMFKLHIINENMIEFKLNKNEHYFLHLPKLRNNLKKQLYKLQELVEENKLAYSIKLTDKFIYITFDETLVQEIKEQKETNVYLALDLNPENIGLSICNYQNNEHNIIHTQEFNLLKITDKLLNLNKSSNSKKSIYLNNKLKHETIEIAKQIIKLANHYNVSNIFIEKLSFNKTIDNKYNKVGNRKIRNLWKKDLFITNLKKRCKLNNICIHKVHPAYTSFIGNLTYDYVDSINASLEIGRRGYETTILKNKDNFYPVISLKHQWKEMANDISNWRSLFVRIKNLKLRYRVSLEDTTYLYKVFQLNSNCKSMVLNYVFMNNYGDSIL